MAASEPSKKAGSHTTNAKRARAHAKKSTDIMDWVRVALMPCWGALRALLLDGSAVGGDGGASSWLLPGSAARGGPMGGAVVVVSCGKGGRAARPDGAAGVRFTTTIDAATPRIRAKTKKKLAASGRAAAVGIQQQAKAEQREMRRRERLRRAKDRAREAEAF